MAKIRSSKEVEAGKTASSTKKKVGGLRHTVDQNLSKKVQIYCVQKYLQQKRRVNSTLQKKEVCAQRNVPAKRFKICYVDIGQGIYKVKI